MKDYMKYRISVVNRNISYTHQIIAGFTMLNEKGTINVDYNETPSLEQEFFHSGIVELFAEGKRIIYDLSDGYNNYPSFVALDNALDRVDIFFKANINRSFHSCFRNKAKIKGIPPRYNVTHPKSWADHIDYSALIKQKSEMELRRIYNRLPWTKYWIGNYFSSAYEMEPVLNHSPIVFFYTRLWDPSIASSQSSKNADLDGKDVKNRIQQKCEEYAKISELRSGLVRALKKEFGPRFIGGVSPDTFSQHYCPDLLGEDISRRSRYTKSLHQADICVNTQGTHKCWNFSFGEELAASKAIVTESPFYEEPAKLQDGENFLTYSSIDECISHVAKLYDDRDSLYSMMKANRTYYLSYLRPDKYVDYSLRVALGDNVFTK